MAEPLQAIHINVGEGRVLLMEHSNKHLTMNVNSKEKSTFSVRLSPHDHELVELRDKITEFLDARS